MPGPKISGESKPNICGGEQLVQSMSVDRSHYEIIPEYMEDLRNRYCVATEDAGDVFDPLEEVTGDKELKAGEFKEAADYLRKNYGSRDMDFCKRGVAGGSGSSWFGSDDSGVKGLSYTIHNSWWGYLMTDALPLCQSISYSLNSFARSLPLSVRQSINQQLAEVDTSKWSQEKMETFNLKKEGCLHALRGKRSARLDGEMVNMEWLCLGALKMLEPEKSEVS